ncbi:hypothetical protein PseudUWO311_06350 [Pseudanabaena sp. UWO311]|uniref:hypothetical protein n=1 Tax=Pseudanabaena sp. UWO311 TaxID=2487337 RepID=UPI00115B2963|nr:hypothetical protein [Pseudanabaena sp. UWO311]TYQ28049.1 hypothetical protein PseudUWO311_06350 [Pseudanabaena sp. UWO311]
MKLKDSDWQGNFGYWQKSFIHANLMMIGYSAWQGFLQHGRGVVVCDIDRSAIAPSNTGLEVTPFKAQFIAEQELVKSIQAFSLDQDLITVLVHAVGNYAPAQELVLLMKMEQHLEINLFQNLKIFPPDCYEQVSRRWEEFQPSLETYIR